jgi:hypothetical protein
MVLADAAAAPVNGFLTTSFVGYSPKSHPQTQTLESSVTQQQLMSRTEKDLIRRTDEHNTRKRRERETAGEHISI